MAGALRQLTPRARHSAPLEALRRSLQRLDWAPSITLLLFLVPISVGLLGTWLPAVGYLPAVGREALSLEPWRQLFAYPGLSSAIGVSLVSGLLGTGVAAVSVVLFVATCHQRPIFRVIKTLLSPLLAIPHAALAIGLAFLLAPSGLGMRLLSPWATGFERPPDLALVQDPLGLALALGLAIKEAPFLLLMTLGALSQSQAEARLNAARSLGYGPFIAWLKVVLPAIYPKLRLPLYAVLAYSLSVVDMAIILGPTVPPSLAVLVFRLFSDPDLSLRLVAAAGATLQLGIVLGALLTLYALERLIALTARSWLSGGQRSAVERSAPAVAGAAVSLTTLLGYASILLLILWSFAWRWSFPNLLPESWSLRSWSNHLPDAGAAALTTLTIGAASATSAVALALACLEHEARANVRMTTAALWLLYLPLLVPQIAFLFGFQVFLSYFALDGILLSVIWAHLLFCLPYAFLALSEPFRRLDPRFARIGACLGASPSRVFWRIKLPLLLRPMLIALAVCFAVSVAQYLPTLFAGAGRSMTLTTEAVALSAGANRRTLAVFAVLQAALPVVVFTTSLAIPTLLYRNRRAMRSGMSA